MNKTHKLMMGLAMSAMAPLACANSETPAPEQAPAEQQTPAPGAAMTPEQQKKLLEEASRKAESLTVEQLRDFLSFGAGYAMGAQYLSDLEGLKVSDIDRALFLQAFADSLKGAPADEFAKLDMRAYLFAVQNLLLQRTTGKPLSMPEGLSKEEQTVFKQLSEAAAKIPEQEVLRFASYFIGYDFAQAFTQNFNAVQADDIKEAPFFEGVETAISNKLPDQYNDPSFTAPYMIGLDKMFSERLAAAGKANLAAGEAFLAENAKKEGVVTTDSGLQYKVLKTSTGEKYDAKKYGENALCSVSYEGRLIDGRVFDAAETPVEFPINGVVPGFSEALKLMPVGSEWEIYIPAKLGYGEQAPAVIGANSVLIFKLKLEGIKEAKGSPANPIELTPEILEQLQQQGLVPMDGTPEPQPAAPGAEPPAAQPDANQPAAPAPAPQPVALR